MSKEIAGQETLADFIEEYSQTKKQQSESEYEKYKDLFALTYKEHCIVKQIDNVLKKIQLENDTQLLVAELFEASKDRILELFTKKRISKKKALAMADRVLSGKWYTLLISASEPKNIAEYPFGLCEILITSNEQKKLLLEDYPEFYKLRAEQPESGFEGFKRERAALHLEEYKFLYGIEWSALTIIQAILTEKKIPEEIKYASMKSDPAFDIYSVSDNAYQNSKQNKAHQIEIYSGKNVLFVSGNKQAELLFRSNFPQKMLDLINEKLYESGYSSNTVMIPIKEIQERQDGNSRSNLLDNLKTFAQLSDSALITFESEDKTKFQNMNITQNSGTMEKRGYFTTHIGVTYFEQLQKNKNRLFIHPNAQKLPNTGNAYTFYKAFAKNQRQQIGAAYGAENRLKVATLLNKSNLPSREETRPGQEYKNIMSKFKSSMDECVEQGIFKEWFFCHPKGIKLTQAELDRLSIEAATGRHDYNLFVSLEVEVVWLNPPDYSHLEERKAEQKRIAAERKEKTAVKEKKQK